MENAKVTYNDREYSIDDILPYEAKPMYTLKGHFYALNAYLNRNETMQEWWEKRGEIDDVKEWWINAA